MRALDRREPDGRDDPAALIFAGATPPGDDFVLCFTDNAAGPRDGNGERAVMATNKKNADKKSPEKEIPERKNNDKQDPGVCRALRQCGRTGVARSRTPPGSAMRWSPKRLSGSGFRSFRPNSRGRWSTISGRLVQAFEHALAGTGQDHARLFRTRQKVAKVGVVQTRCAQ